MGKLLLVVIPVAVFGVVLTMLGNFEGAMLAGLIAAAVCLVVAQSARSAPRGTLTFIRGVAFLALLVTGFWAALLSGQNVASGLKAAFYASVAASALGVVLTSWKLARLPEHLD